MSESQNEQMNDYSIAKGFAVSSLMWGLAGMAIGNNRNVRKPESDTS